MEKHAALAGEGRSEMETGWVRWQKEKARETFEVSGVRKERERRERRPSAPEWDVGA